MSLIKRIFELAVDGYGSTAITLKFNREAIPAFGRSNGWHESYVTKILKNRAVFGEYQPHRMQSGKRIPIGEPIKDYFPAVIDEDTFYLVQEARTARAYNRGPKGPKLANLFTNIARCEYCRSPMWLINKGSSPRGGKYLKCSGAVRGLGCDATAWKYEDFEQSFLYFVSEIDLAQILGANAENEKRNLLNQQLTAAKAKLQSSELARDRTYSLIGNTDLDIQYLTEKLKQHSADISKINDQIKALTDQFEKHARPETPEPEKILLQIDEIRSAKGTDSLDKRIRLASKLRDIISSLLLAPNGRIPKIQKISNFLQDNVEDVAFKEQLLQYISKSRDITEQNNPEFMVSFHDGFVRHIIVNKSSPIKYERITRVDATGSAEIHRDETIVWKKQIRRNQADDNIL